MITALDTTAHTIMMSSSNEADLHDDSLDLDDDKPSRAHASDEGDNGVEETGTHKSAKTHAEEVEKRRRKIPVSLVLLVRRALQQGKPAPLLYAALAAVLRSVSRPAGVVTLTF